MSLHLRPAVLSDRSALAQIMAESSLAAYNGVLPSSVLARESFEVWEKRWRELLGDDDHWTLLALEHGRPCGLALTYADKGDAAVFGLLHLLPAAWGQGMAKALHDASLGALRERGFRTCTLWVLETNRRARRFYDKRGWNPTGERRDFIKDVTSLRYQRSLIGGSDEEPQLPTG